MHVQVCVDVCVRGGRTRCRLSATQHQPLCVPAGVQLGEGDGIVDPIMVLLPSTLAGPLQRVDASKVSDGTFSERGRRQFRA